ncbi:MAG: hypothetical protein U5L00_17410 [Desulfovermiculus sp.]|nr:hypothetical protein [Desulfovermiculus sp.]
MSFGPRKNRKNNIFERLANVYATMESRYDEVASRLGLTCTQCTDNCCRSYFQHHTYIEWAYVWQGMNSLQPEHRQAVMDRAQENVDQCQELLAQGKQPRVMCPLNEQGLCILYPYRLMICRLHGVPNQVRMPNGQVKQFSGCQKCQDLTAKLSRIPVLDRTPLYIELVLLERELLGSRRRQLPHVDMTLSEMLVRGEPPIQGE